jgi:hypothetical protein
VASSQAVSSPIPCVYLHVLHVTRTPHWSSTARLSHCVVSIQLPEEMMFAVAIGIISIILNLLPVLPSQQLYFNLILVLSQDHTVCLSTLDPAWLWAREGSPVSLHAGVTLDLQDPLVSPMDSHTFSPLFIIIINIVLY